MDRRLYEASLIGNTSSFQKLLEEDELILDRALASINAPENPLHIAALRGHVEFTFEILCRRPELAHELNSLGLSPLHLASANGHVGVVKEILKFAPDSVSRRDREGRTPLHTAMAKGRIEVVKELTRDKPELIWDVTSGGETILHLCVKHEHIEALKLLEGSVSYAELVNRKDDNGNTVLHLSTAMKHFHMIKFLIEKTPVEVNTRNKNGLTALDILTLYPKESIGEMEIADTLQRNGAKRSWQLSEPSGERSEIAIADPHQSQQSNSPDQHSKAKEESAVVSALASLSKQIKDQRTEEMKQKQGDDSRNTMMVVAVLILTAAFTAILTPPGGLWQDDSNPTGSSNTTAAANSGHNHEAGNAILDKKDPTGFALFWFFNKLSFFASLFLITSNIDNNNIIPKTHPAKHLLWLALFSMEFMYIFSGQPVTRGAHKRVYFAEVLGAAIALIVAFLPSIRKRWRQLRRKGPRHDEAEA